MAAAPSPELALAAVLCLAALAAVRANRGRDAVRSSLALAPRKVLPIARISEQVLEDIVARESLSRSDKRLAMLCVQLGCSYAHWLARRFAATVIAVNPDAELSAADFKQSQARGLDVVHIRADGYRFDARDAVEGAGFAVVIVDVGEEPSRTLLGFAFRALEPGVGVALIQSRYGAAILSTGFEIEERLGPVEDVDVARFAFQKAVAEYRPGWAPPFEPGQSYTFICRRPVDARPRALSSKPVVARLVDDDGLRLRVGCVCTRGKGSVLLVSSSKHRGILPGGGVEAGETIEQAALREASEEAGVQGRVLRELTTFVSATAKTQYVHIAVDAVKAQWDEQWRARRFVASSEAMAFLGEGAQREAVRAALQQPVT